MPQRFNFTGRKRIFEDEAKIHVLKDTNPLKIHLEQSFSSSQCYSPNDIVMIEAIRRTRRDRVQIGKISELANSEEIVFQSFQDGNDVLFRIYVVDPSTSKKKGQAKRLRDADKSQNPSSIKSILPVELSQEEDEMGDCFWKLKFDDNNPLLLLSSKKFSSFEPTKSSEFKALVWPEILRQVLVYIYIVRWNAFPSWEEDWKKYVEVVIGAVGAPKEEPQNPDEEYIERTMDWINDAVRGFAQHVNLSDTVIPNFNSIGE